MNIGLDIYISFRVIIKDKVLIHPFMGKFLNKNNKLISNNKIKLDKSRYLYDF